MEKNGESHNLLPTQVGLLIKTHVKLLPIIDPLNYMICKSLRNYFLVPLEGHLKSMNSPLFLHLIFKSERDLRPIHRHKMSDLMPIHKHKIDPNLKEQELFLHLVISKCFRFMIPLKLCLTSNIPKLQARRIQLPRCLKKPPYFGECGPNLGAFYPTQKYTIFGI